MKAFTTTPARSGYAIVEEHPNSTTHTTIETDSLFLQLLLNRRNHMLLHEHYKGQKTRWLTFIQIQSTAKTSFIPTARSGRNEVFLTMK
jgi:hypothetical protein